MNYEQIKTLALSYADEEGTEAIVNMDNFLRIVESRVNRELAVQKMVVESETAIVVGQSKYGLPEDFGGIRDIEVYTPPDGTKTTLKYFSPEQMNNNTSGQPAYTIIADQVEIVPTVEGQALRIAYYRRIPPLSETEDENWVSIDNPDLYVFGLMTEISAFNKDADSTNIWNSRFSEAIDAIRQYDSKARWSGTALQIRVG